METKLVKDMTVDELKAIIAFVIDERLRNKEQPGEKRSLQEIFDSIDRHRWTPPPGAKSSLELLREDRDR
ncbi:MAG: hypothetical protein KME60_08255 [Cyanomargarita calcarea GSE-NOS-MK-12-04C]|jgi:hypothetical protein|uniref:Uncharacterized protein n=1 Tax=Cyanomargarita calcarea GSE-NOS-MK-12-04C TaxID=2839659 RepID=A0A951QJX4_9CYAN|nr:hypothetical protein [Cyanomargarita calcarea GSE-NOS-MK-12-04C]